jgi:hypothetical protein
MGGQRTFSQANGFRRHLNHLIIPDELNGPLQGHGEDRRQDNRVILAGGPHVGELLGLAGIHVQIAVPVMLSDDHSLVHRIAGAHKELSTGFEIEQGVGHALPAAIGHEGTRESRGELAAELFIAVQRGIQYSGSPGIGEELVAISDEAPGRDAELQAGAIALMAFVVHHSAFALGKLLGHDSGEIVVTLDIKVFDRLQELAAVVLVDNPGPPPRSIRSLPGAWFPGVSPSGIPPDP